MYLLKIFATLILLVHPKNTFFGGLVALWANPLQLEKFTGANSRSEIKCGRLHCDSDLGNKMEMGENVNFVTNYIIHFSTHFKNLIATFHICKISLVDSVQILFSHLKTLFPPGEIGVNGFIALNRNMW